MYADTSRRHHNETSTLARTLRWRDANRYFAAEIPTPLRPWLLAEGSLTQLLIAASANDFRVERVLQEWQRPTLSEARLLRVDPSHHALIREVILWGRGQPWVYARSVIPSRSLRGDLRRLRKLRNSSLGALLFRYPQLRRTPFELAATDADAMPARLRPDITRPLNAEPPNAATLWGRRSRFTIDNRALIVGEIFLGDFVKTVAQTPSLQQLPKRKSRHGGDTTTSQKQR